MNLRTAALTLHPCQVLLDALYPDLPGLHAYLWRSPRLLRLATNWCEAAAQRQDDEAACLRALLAFIDRRAVQYFFAYTSVNERRVNA